MFEGGEDDQVDGSQEDKEDSAKSMSFERDDNEHPFERSLQYGGLNNAKSDVVQRVPNTAEHVSEENVMEEQFGDKNQRPRA